MWEIELIAFELKRFVHQQRFIVGGDLNSALLFTRTTEGNATPALFSNLREAGFIDLRNDDGEQQTYFKDGKGPTRSHLRRRRHRCYTTLLAGRARVGAGLETE